MTVEEATRFLPESTQMKNVFSGVFNTHPVKDVMAVGAIVFYAGLAHFATRGHDPKMREMGTTSFHAVEDGRVRVHIAEDMASAAVHLLGVSQEYALANFSDDGAHFFVGSLRNSSEEANLLIPSEFAFTAYRYPIDTLAFIGWSAAQITDVVLGKFDAESEMRANAMRKSILLEAKRQDPSYEFPEVTMLRRELRHYTRDAMPQFNSISAN